MRLRELLRDTRLTARGADDPDVTRIVNDSTKVIPGSLFIAIKGIARDGHDFLAQAVDRGATSLVVEDEARVPPGFTGTVVVVPDGRAALNRLSGAFFGDPGRAMFCIGVTGTDGKTSVTCMAEAVLAACGFPTGVMGTVDHHLITSRPVASRAYALAPTSGDTAYFGEHRWPGDTTPPPLVLQERLAQFLALGARAVALEATSQGLSQSRVSGVPFDVAVFTNLTRDHLDYHRTLDAYFAAKERLFTEALATSPKPRRHAIVNVDTDFGPRLRVPPGVTRWTYGKIGSGADLVYEPLTSTLSHSVFRLRGWGQEAELRLPMMGEFNGANALAAVAVGIAAGGDFSTCVEALRGFAGVPGRVQRVAHPGTKAVFIDYAHDPDAFEKVLTTAREAMHRERAGARLVTVFGCGGDRDRGKRPLMLESALRLSDRVFVTSDNPRSEDPRAIVDDMLAGVRTDADRARVVVELDRAKAIHLALDSTADRDVVMLLGKGHEAVQIVGDQRIPHSDHAVVAAKLGVSHVSRED